MNNSDKSDVLIIGETADGSLHPTVHQLISAAKKITHQNGSIALSIPDDSYIDHALLNNLDVDAVYLMQHPLIAEDQHSGIYDTFTQATAAMVNELKPSALLFAKTDLGSVVAARVSAKNNIPLAADCIDLALNSVSGRVAVTRPVHGGNALGIYEFSGEGLQTISIRPGSFDPAESSADNVPSIEHVDLSDISIPDNQPLHIETVSEEGEGIPLEKAEIVVAGGRGLGGEKPFDELRELCDVLGAALGASRAACDAGWIDHSHQVGLTGKSISPVTYITVGISGASQHMAGCSAARNIIAINSDPEANIFAHSRFGVVGDWQKVIPAFTAALAEL